MRFRLDGAAFQKALEAAIAKTITERVCLEVGATARDIIRSRTESGRDVDGKPFRPYSTRPCYISLQERPAPRGGVKTPRTSRKISNYNRRSGASMQTARKSARGGKTMFFPRGYAEYKANLYGAVVNLTKTGRMLSSLYVEARDRLRVIIGFYGREANDKAQWNNETRPFFGIRQAQEKARLVAAWRKANGV
jgi:hypothetical protein